MIYTVVWKPAALNELADIWVAAADRAAVTSAANLIDTILRQDPYTYSESRTGSTRIMFASPLGVTFDVSDPDCLVTVTAVWQIA